jgi:hypothetical protein
MYIAMSNVLIDNLSSLDACIQKLENSTCASHLGFNLGVRGGASVDLPSADNDSFNSDSLNENLFFTLIQALYDGEKPQVLNVLINRYIGKYPSFKVDYLFLNSKIQECDEHDTDVNRSIKIILFDIIVRNLFHDIRKLTAVETRQADDSIVSIMDRFSAIRSFEYTFRDCLEYKINKLGPTDGAMKKRLSKLLFRVFYPRGRFYVETLLLENIKKFRHHEDHDEIAHIVNNAVREAQDNEYTLNFGYIFGAVDNDSAFVFSMKSIIQSVVLKISAKLVISRVEAMLSRSTFESLFSLDCDLFDISFIIDPQLKAGSLTFKQLRDALGNDPSFKGSALESELNDMV